MTTLILSPEARESAREQLRAVVRAVPDFPKPGILFRDITTVLADKSALETAIRLHADAVADLVGQVDCVVGIESRGFLFGIPVAERLGAAFAPVRKPGKLPAAVVEQSYELEYGEDRLQLHADAIRPGAKVVVVDDLLATGGTAEATCKLIARLGGEVTCCLFMIELDALAGRARLAPTRVESLIHY
ncbi:MAG: adenine phosphoribosyltransferase [Myxococcales bacterium]|nr:adenine phosphoribosyltransferase [Myxococcales bacterium]